MADNFGLKLGIDGEREFKKALSEINQSFKVLGSEMKLVSSQFDKNDKSVESLTARNQVLNKEIDAQKEKIETLKSALANAAESFGENDKRTQAWQVQLNNAQSSLRNQKILVKRRGFFSYIRLYAEWYCAARSFKAKIISLFASAKNITFAARLEGFFLFLHISETELNPYNHPYTCFSALRSCKRNVSKGLRRFSVSCSEHV